jgi:hypothetical protein
VAEDLGVSPALWSETAAKLTGFSGRQIAKLANAWQATAYASVDNTLSRKMLLDVMEHHIAQLNTKRVWESTFLPSSR